MVDDRAHTLIAPLVKEIVHRTRPSSVILAGSYGRGEGIIREQSGKISLVNDVDLVVVFDKAPSWKTRRVLREIAANRASTVGVRHIDLIPVSLHALGCPDVSMLHLDIKFGGAVVWGNSTVLDAIPCAAGASPSSREVLNLLVNRMVTLFEAHPAFSAHLSGPERARQLSKVFFALVDAWAANHQMYRTLYKEKIASLYGASSAIADTEQATLVHAIEWAVPAWRMDTTQEYAEAIVTQHWGAIADLLCASIVKWTSTVSGFPVSTSHECSQFWRGGGHSASSMARIVNRLRNRRHKFTVERDMFSLLFTKSEPSKERLLHHIQEWYRAWQ